MHMGIPFDRETHFSSLLNCLMPAGNIKLRTFVLETKFKGHSLLYVHAHCIPTIFVNNFNNKTVLLFFVC